MLTKMTGKLVRVLDDEARVEVGPFEYQVMVPEVVRRQLQLRVGHECVLHISEYYEGNQTGSRMVPRKIGFLSEWELEFFELLCTVEKIGVKKALRAMSRTVKEMADAVQRQDVRWLSTLPGIGPATAEQIAVALKKKVAHFAAVAPGPTPAAAEAVDGEEVTKTKKKKPMAPSAPPTPSVEPQLIEDIYQSMIVMGMNPIDARSKLDSLLTSGKTFATLDEAFKLIFGKA